MFFLLLICFLKFSIELINDSVRLNSTLLTSVEGMAIGTSVNFDFFKYRSGFKGRTAGNACHLALVVLWVNSFFHTSYNSFRLTEISAKRAVKSYYSFKRIAIILFFFISSFFKRREESLIGTIREE